MAKKAVKKAAPKKAAKKSSPKKGGEKKEETPASSNINPENLPAKLRPKAHVNVRYVYPDEEVIQKAQQLSEEIQKKSRIEDELKSIKSEFKMKIDACQGIINMLSQQVSAGHEYKNMECEYEKDFANGVKIFFHNGIKVHEEKLEARDYVMQLEFVESENAKNND